MIDEVTISARMCTCSMVAYVYMHAHANLTGKFELNLMPDGHRRDLQTRLLFKRGLGVSERSEFTPCIHIIYIIIASVGIRNV